MSKKQRVNKKARRIMCKYGTALYIDKYKVISPVDFIIPIISHK